MLTRIIVALVLLAGLAAAGRWAYTTIYDAGAASCAAAHQAAADKTAAETRAKRETAAATAASVLDAAEIDMTDTATRTAESVRVITRIVHDTPAADCVLPVDSLRELQAAVDRANAATGDRMR